MGQLSFRDFAQDQLTLADGESFRTTGDFDFLKVLSVSEVLSFGDLRVSFDKGGNFVSLVEGLEYRPKNGFKDMVIRNFSGVNSSATTISLIVAYGVGQLNDNRASLDASLRREHMFTSLDFRHVNERWQETISATTANNNQIFTEIGAGNATPNSAIITYLSMRFISSANADAEARVTLSGSGGAVALARIHNSPSLYVANENLLSHPILLSKSDNLILFTTTINSSAEAFASGYLL